MSIRYQTIFMYGIEISEPLLKKLWMRERPDNYTPLEWWDEFLMTMDNKYAECLDYEKEETSRLWILGKPLPSSVELIELRHYTTALEPILFLYFPSTDFANMIAAGLIKKPALHAKQQWVG